MRCGLVLADGSSMLLENIDCTASVTSTFGIFTLSQRYRNTSGSPADARFVFPLLPDAVVTGFSVQVGGRSIASEVIDKSTAALFSHSQKGRFAQGRQSGVFETHIGVIPLNAEAVISVTYFCSFQSVGGGVRLVIPTVIPLRYVSCSEQLAIANILDEVRYGIKLALIYRGLDVVDITSPSHNLNVEVDAYGADVSIDEETVQERDIVIDITHRQVNRPVMFCNTGSAYYAFTPKLDIFRHIPRDYVFVVDASPIMTGERMRQVKNALTVCLRALKAGDRFNLMAYSSAVHTLFDAPEPFGGETLTGAKKWLDGLSAQSGSCVLRPLMLACENKNPTVVLITGSDTENWEDTLTQVRSATDAVFYTFGIDDACGSEFLTRLAAGSGGFATAVMPDERIDETIIGAFNRIVVPVVKNAAVTFDRKVADVSPNAFKRIHAWQGIEITASFDGAPPKALTVSGEFTGLSCVMDVSFDTRHEAGEELTLYHAKRRMDELVLRLTGDDLRDTLTKKRIGELSVAYGLLSNETALLLSCGDGGKKTVTDVVMPSNVPALFRHKVLAGREKSKKKTRTDEYIRLLGAQLAHGAFAKRGKTTQIATAEALLYLCAEAKTPELYIWQLRKAAEYLLGSLQRSNSAVIPEVVLDAFEAWNRKFYTKHDEISQKVAALTFMYGNNR